MAVPTIPIYVLLPAFYADAMGLGLIATGLALLAARAFDVVTDPVVGLLSDRLRTRWGRRKPPIAVGGVLAGIALLQLLDPAPGAGVWHLASWAVVLYVGWTLVAVPYTAWGAELSPHYHERGRIAGAREAVMLLGILAAAAVPAVVAARGGGEQDGLTAVAWIAIGLGAPAMLILLARLPDRATHGRQLPALDRRALISMLRNGPFVRLVSAWFVNGLANGFPAVLFPLYLTHVLAATDLERSTLIALYFVCAAAAIPIWIAVTRRLGKHRTWCAAMVLACAAFVWVPWVPEGGIIWFAAICVVTGAALGADLALPPAMQADVLDLDALRTGEQRAGLFFAVWGMATKLALAAAVGIAFPALELAGFDPGASNTGTAILAVILIYSVVPVVLKLGAVAIVWRHPLTERNHRAIRRQLDRRAAAERNG
jgi:Na+/melibiose symporter-like transporter